MLAHHWQEFLEANNKRYQRLCGALRGVVELVCAPLPRLWNAGCADSIRDAIDALRQVKAVRVELALDETRAVRR